MTRRGRFTCWAIIAATVGCLGFLPMQMPVVAVIPAWIASVVLVVMVACWIDSLMWKREERTLRMQRKAMWTQIRRTMEDA